jgi:hypothetical protein
MYTKFSGFKIHEVRYNTYTTTGNTAIQLMNNQEGPIACATVNVIPLPKDWIAIDTNNNGEEMVDWLLENNIIIGKQLRTVESGYCSYPVYRLNSH